MNTFWISSKKKILLSLFLIVALGMQGCGHSNTESGSISEGTKSEANTTGNSEMQEEEEEIVASYEDEDLDEIAGISHMIIGQDEKGYYKVLSGCEDIPDTEGKVHISRAQKLPVVYIEGQTDPIILNRVQEKTEDGKKIWVEDFIGKSEVESPEQSDQYTYFEMKMDADSPDADGAVSYTLGLRDDLTTYTPYAEDMQEHWEYLAYGIAYGEDIDDALGNSSDIFFAWDAQYAGTSFDAVCVKAEDVNSLTGSYYLVIQTDYKDGRTEYSEPVLLSQNSGSVFPSDGTSLEYGTADLETDNGTLSFRIYDDHAILTSYEGEDETVSVPENVEGVPVTIIGSMAFAENTSVKEVVMPETITDIQAEAFSGMNLKKITLPESLEYLGSNAFDKYNGDEDTDNQEAITIEIGKNVKWIGESPFDGYKIDSYQVSEDNTRYQSVDGVLYADQGESLFLCPSARNGEFNVPDGVKRICYDAFNDGSYSYGISDTDLITSLAVSDSVEEIMGGYYLRNLKKISVGASLKRWEDADLCNADIDIEISGSNPNFTVDNGVLYDGNKEKLYRYLNEEQTDYTIPESVQYIETNAFSGCLLQNMAIEGNQCLSGMKMSEITICFGDMSNLQSVEVADTNQTLSSQDGCLFSKNKEIMILYPPKKQGDSFDVPEGVVSLGEYCFRSTSLKTLNLSSTVKDLALYGSDGLFLSEFYDLETITVASENPYYAAKDCYLYQKDEGVVIGVLKPADHKIEFAEDITEIGEYVFSSYSALEGVDTVEFSEGLKKIGGQNFNYITQSDQWDTIDFYLPDSLTEISEESFMESPGIVFHASEGSYAAEFAKEHGITLETE